MKIKLLISFVFTFISIYSFSQSIELSNNNAISIIKKAKDFKEFNSQYNTKSNAVFLDSLHTKEENNMWTDRKILMFYDNFGKDTLWVEYAAFIGQNNYSKVLKISYSYNSNHQLIKKCEFPFDYSLNNWIYSSVSHYKYNSNGFLIERIDTSFNASNNDIYKVTYNYDNYDNIISYLYYSQLNTATSFTPKYRFEYKYNSQKYITEIKISDWQNNSWNYLTKSSRQYDTNNNILKSIDFSTSNNGTIWDTTHYNLFIYNNSNELLNAIYISWNDNRYSKKIYSYNSNHYRTQWIQYDSIQGSSSYKKNRKETFSYDNSYNLVLNEQYKWDTLINTWIFSRKKQNSFDLNTSNSNIIYPYDFYSYSLKNDNNIRLTKVDYEFDSYQNQWNLIDSIRYFYSSKNYTSIDSKKLNNNISIYPNPAKTDFVIKTTNSLKRISIYNLQGKLIENQLVKGNGNTYKLIVEGYISGVYFIKLEFMNGQSLTKKLIKL